MRFRIKLLAALVVVTVVVLPSQAHPEPASADVASSAGTQILTGFLRGLGSGTGSAITNPATTWALSLLGFDTTGGTANLGPQLKEIQQTLDQLLVAQQQVSADLNNINCDTWTTAILGNVANIEANWNTFNSIAYSTAQGKTSNLTPGFINNVLGPDETALGMETNLETIYNAVFPSAGTGVVDTCLKAAAVNNPPPLYSLDRVWYDTYVVPFQTSLMLEYSRAMTMVTNAYHHRALLAARANGMPDGDFLNLAPLICEGFYDGPDPLSTTKPSGYCDSANNFVRTHLADLRQVVARGGAAYTDDKVAYYHGTDYLLARSLSQYGASTVGTYDASFPNDSGYDGYSGTWGAASVKLFEQILSGWVNLGGKDTTTAGYWLCHATGNPSANGDACIGLAGVGTQIILFPETSKSSKSSLNTKYLCFMDGSITRDKVEGQPFCDDYGKYGLQSLVNGGKCSHQVGYEQKGFTQTLASGDPDFYKVSRWPGNKVDNPDGEWCTRPGWSKLKTEKPRWPAFAVSQITCTNGYPAYNPAGMRTKCGADFTRWLDDTVPLAPPVTYASTSLRSAQPQPEPDSHAPVIEASLDFVADQEGSLGYFEVSYSCTDDVDSVVFLEARLNGVIVENGDTAELIPSSFEEFSYSTEEGKPHMVWGSSFELTVTCSDRAGNTSEVTVPAVFPQEASGDRTRRY